MIVQCIDSIRGFTLILIYIVFCYGTFFFLKAEEDGETSLLSSVGQVATLMTGGFDFDDKSDSYETWM